MTMSIACESLQNFRFEGRSYRIVKAGIDRNGEPYATIEPHDESFHKDLLKYIKDVKFQNFNSIVYGSVDYPEFFYCFAGKEDHEKQLLLNQKKTK